MFHAHLIIHPNKETRQKHITQFCETHGIHPIDILFLEDDTVTIAEVRNLIRFLRLSPVSSYKVGVIAGDNLTLDAQHALLKTFEEPLEKRILFLTATHKDIVISTLVSRCHIEWLSAPQASEISADLSVWKKLLSEGVGERLRDISEYVKDRETTVKFLKTHIAALRTELLNRYTGSKTSTLPQQLYPTLLRRLSTAYTQITHNVSPKLALDHVLLHLPQINH